MSCHFNFYSSVGQVRRGGCNIRLCDRRLGKQFPPLPLQHGNGAHQPCIVTGRQGQDFELYQALRYEADKQHLQRLRIERRVREAARLRRHV